MAFHTIGFLRSTAVHTFTVYRPRFETPSPAKDKKDRLSFR